MATLVDHGARSKTHGTVDNLTGLMVAAQVSAYRMRLAPAAKVRACEALVRAAIRRGGLTDARQELVLSAEERETWERANPLP